MIPRKTLKGKGDGDKAGTYENIPDGQVWPWHMTGQTDQSNVNHRHEELNIIIQDTFILLTYTSAESMSLYNDEIVCSAQDC